MATFLVVAGVMFGAFGGFISVLVLAKKYSWKIGQDEPFGAALGVCVVSGGLVGYALVDVLCVCGVCVQTLAVLALAPALVFAVVFGLNAAPRVRTCVDELTDWLVTLTVPGPSKNQLLKRRIDELETVVLDIQSQKVGGKEKLSITNDSAAGSVTG